MKKSQFDKNLKDNLQQYISKVDTHSLWTNIESEVDAVNKNKHKKKRFFFWFLSLGMILLGGTFYLTLKISDRTPQVAKSEILSTSIVMPTFTPLVEKDNIISTVKKTTPNIIEKKEDKISQNNILKKPITENNFSNNNSITNQSIKYFSPSENKKPVLKTNYNLPNQEEKKEETTPTLKIGKTPILAATFSLLENKLIIAEDWSIAAADLRRNDSKSKKQPLQFSFGVQGGASKTSRGLLSGRSETIDYIDLRKETEKVLETIHMGALISITHRSGFEISSGVQWTSITEKFEFEGSRIQSDTIEDGLYGYYINPYGDTIPVYDQVIHQSEVFFNKRSYNKYRMIGIPIILGYHWRNGNWSLGVEGGVITNISLKTSGQIFNPEGDIIDIEEEQNNVFHTKVGLNYSLGFSGKYFITDHLQIGINPTFRFFPKSFTLSNYPLNQKYYIMGGNLGLRYSF